MKRYIFDTGAFTDLVNRRSPAYDRVRAVLADGHKVGVCPPILGEFYAGLELSDNPTRSHQLLHTTMRLVIIWPYDLAAAAMFGRIFATLRRLGRPMQQVDIQLAAVALTLGRTTVVSRDSDLRAVPGLDVEDWSIPS